MAKWIFLLAILLSSMAQLQAADRPQGSIEGRVVDGETRLPLQAVRVRILQTGLSAQSDGEGKFAFPAVPAGSYILDFSTAGYETVAATDIVVRPGRRTAVLAVLKTATPRLDERVTVSGRYFSKSEEAPASTFNFSAEEIRRAPGAYGDISRMIKMLPGTAGAADSHNDLIVRGGNPAETGYIVDNIEISSLNHFPTLRSSGGRYSALNPDLIQDVDFFTGTFPAEYGERLSSIMSIRLREGNPRTCDGQFDFNLGAAGGVFEGPLPGKTGSWLVSFRRSYLTFLEKLGIVSFRCYVPRMQDGQAKAVLTTSDRSRLTLIDFFGSSGYEKEESGRSEDFSSIQNTLGLNWQIIWGGSGYSDTSLALSYLKNQNYKWQSAAGGGDSYDTRLSETALALRHSSFWKVSGRFTLHIGLQARRERLRNYYSEERSSGPAADWDRANWSTRAALFSTAVLKPHPDLSIAIGARLDHSTLTHSFSLSPRFSLNCQVGAHWSVHAGVGMSRQSLSLLLPLLRWNRDSYSYPDPGCFQLTWGIEYLPDPSSKFSIEVYEKQYFRLAVSPEYPEILLMDRRLYESPLLPQVLLFNGRAYGRGVELFWQKKLTRKFYGMASLSLALSRYRAHSGSWHNRNYDHRLIANIAAGFRPGRNWEFSGRLTCTDGLPFTPFDMAKSQRLNRGVFDVSRTNGERLPAYLSINLRGEKRFNFRNSNLVVYIEVWNLLDRGNVYFYRWNTALRGVEAEYEFPRIPLLGLEFEF